MKNLLLFLFCISFIPINAQGPIKVNVENVFPSNCDNPVRFLESQGFQDGIDLDFNSTHQNVYFSATWVYYLNGEEVAAIEEGSGYTAGNRTLVYNASPSSGGGDFPNGLESGVYEVALRLCFSKPSGPDQPLITQVLGNTQCVQTLSSGPMEICCEVTLGCIEYIDCPDPKLELNKFGTIFNASFPPGATNWVISARAAGKNGTYLEKANSIPVQEGCWLYCISVQYPNGCISETCIDYCSKFSKPPSFPGDLNDGGFTSTTPPSRNLNVFPVPFTDQLSLQSTKELAELIITDITGKQILRQSIGLGTTTVQTNSWESGIYFIQLIDAEGILQQQKVIKQ